MMSGGAGSVVEWTNRSVYLAEGAALSLTPCGVSLALAEIATDGLGSLSERFERDKFNSNQIVGGFLLGSLGHAEKSLINTSRVREDLGGGLLGTLNQGVATLALPLNAASAVASFLQIRNSGDEP